MGIKVKLSIFIEYSIVVRKVRADVFSVDMASQF